MKTKNHQENWEERFDELFDSDVVCCNEGSQITHFGELELFKEVKSFIKELLKSEKEKLLERIRLKKWERTKRRDVIATEMNRIMCETRNNTIKELEKLKESIKKEL